MPRPNSPCAAQSPLPSCAQWQGRRVALPIQQQHVVREPGPGLATIQPTAVPRSATAWPCKPPPSLRPWGCEPRGALLKGSGPRQPPPRTAAGRIHELSLPGAPILLVPPSLYSPPPPPSVHPPPQGGGGGDRHLAHEQ